MTYAINSPYEEKLIHPKGMTDNSVTYITLEYATEGMGATIHNVDRGGGLI